MGDPGIHIRRVPAGSLEASLVPLLRSVFEGSFPAEERPPFEMFLHDVEHSARELWVTQPFMGFAGTVRLQSADDDYLLEYLAVDPIMRNRGVGVALLDAVTSDIATPVVLEVEEPEVSPDVFAARRITFYARYGARRVPHSKGYSMPNFVTGGLLPMQLWDLVPARRRHAPTPDEVRDLVSQIWRTSYEVADGDERLAVVLDQLAD
jgi:GNAT superfamily N-acetyltransferase